MTPSPAGSASARRTDGGGPTAGFQNVVRIYQAASGEVHALRGVDVDFPNGSVTAIAGPSGGGKSTLLSILALRDRATAGTVTMFGTDVTRVRPSASRALRRKSIAWVPQRPSHGLLPQLSARDNLVQVARTRGGDTGWGPDETLELLGLTARAHGRPGQLSGGEQQRLAVAAALIHAPDLVVADEPTAELDDPNAERVIAALLAVAAAGSTCVLSTHDSRALRLLPRVLHLRHGVLSAERSGTEAGFARSARPRRSSTRPGACSCRRRRSGSSRAAGPGSASTRARSCWTRRMRRTQRTHGSH
jgi:ABC-type lipoprotein export system ATPase subunit